MHRSLLGVKLTSIFFLGAVGLVVPAWAADAATGAQGALSLTARLVDSDSRPCGGMFTFWRAAEPRNDVSRDPWQAAETVQEWNDVRNGRVWRPFYNCGSGKEATAKGLGPGDYRITAAAGAGPTPLAVSAIIHLDGNSPATRIQLQLEAGGDLEIAAVDSSTKKPLPEFQAILLGDNGLPIVRWSSFPWITSSGNRGELTFKQLPAGRYRLDVRGRAWYADEPEYRTEKGPLEIEVVSGQNREMSVAVKPVALAEHVIQERWPWVLQGQVVDEQGQGLQGVTITAHCGMGTLFPTGRTQTGRDGSYVLRFGPGFTSRDPVALQAATISPAKSGYAETNLHRQGDLLMAKRMPDPGKNYGWKTDPGRVVLPERPFTLDFVMAPAASVNGVLMDGQNHPMAGQRVDISGPELPPSCSVLAEVTTDQDGRFQIAELPVQHTWWIALSGKGALKTESIKFNQPAAHNIVLRIRERDGQTRLELARQAD